jgi:hypothetical protein
MREANPQGRFEAPQSLTTRGFRTLMEPYST